MLRMNMNLIKPHTFVQQNFNLPKRRVLYTWLDAFLRKNIEKIPGINLQDVSSKIKNYFPYVSIKEEDPAEIIKELSKAIRLLVPNSQKQFGDWLDQIFTKVLPEDIHMAKKIQIREEAALCFPKTIRAQIKAGLFRSLSA